MFEKDAEEYSEKDLGGKYLSSVVAKDKLHAYKLGQYDGFLEGAEFGYNKANEEHEEKCKTAYIKGIRTMANALKDYDRTDGAWTDYFEHTVEKVLKKLLQESE